MAVLRTFDDLAERERHVVGVMAWWAAVGAMVWWAAVGGVVGGELQGDAVAAHTSSVPAGMLRTLAAVASKLIDLSAGLAKARTGTDSSRQLTPTSTVTNSSASGWARGHHVRTRDARKVETTWPS